MPQPRTIKDYFKRPQFALSLNATASQSLKKQNPEKHSLQKHVPELGENSDSLHLTSTLLPSSPLSDPPLSPSSPHTASSLLETGPDLQLWESLQETIAETRDEEGFKSSKVALGNSFITNSFNSSHRVVKDGKEVVISSDYDDTDSIESLESSEALLRAFMSPASEGDKGAKAKVPDVDISSNSGPAKNKRTVNRLAIPQVSTPKYKFTLESLVTDTVDDNETEAGVAKIKSAFKSFGEGTGNGTSETDNNRHREVREDVLATALAEDADSIGLQRLLDAVRRTEAFDQEKSWSFFHDQAETPSPPEFPRDSILPTSKEAFLRDTASRERAFYSGVVELALRRNLLPDEVVKWIFHSVPFESQDELRYAYCRTLKLCPANRIASLIRPTDINDIFLALGAKSAALTFYEPIIPEALGYCKSPSKDHRCFLSALDLFRGAANLFANDSREYLLQILFRLSVDTSLMRDSVICSELEWTITTLLQSLSDDHADNVIHRVCVSLYKTVEDVGLQSQLLKHILPTSPWIALLRCRLGMAFFLRDLSPLIEPPDAVLELRRITHHLYDKRFNVKAYESKERGGYDYSNLSAATSLLNVVIDLGWSLPTFPDIEAETKFNANVDALADRIKRIFTSIEDSGASHLKRTETKQSLEALYYRIVYSVRSKPPPKKTFFGSGIDDWGGIGHSGSLIEKLLSSQKAKKGPKTSTRENELES